MTLWQRVLNAVTGIGRNLEDKEEKIVQEIEAEITAVRAEFTTELQKLKDELAAVRNAVGLGITVAKPVTQQSSAPATFG